ncbi:MAG TPA: hypothetical protein VMN81_03410 [Vicinamibacterales bacterium]|nr:hypothetical protein [Vicinamibacterales bacterium]
MTVSRAFGHTAKRVLPVALLPLAASLAAAPAPGDEPTRRLPERLEHYVSATVRLTAAERAQLFAGAPVTRMLDADPGREVAVFGAIWLDAPARAYVEAVSDIEAHERGGAYLATKRLGDPARAEDFASLRLPDGDVRDLRDCRVGDCAVKLDQPTIEAIRAAAGRAEGAFRERALALVSGYRARGNAALPVYRDKPEPAAVAFELQALAARLPPIAAGVPAVRRYLIDYPRAPIPDARDFVYWQLAKFGLKPTVRISHVVIDERPDATIVASKMLYASHYFIAAVELRVLTPDPSRGPGVWLMTVSRSRADGLGGLKGLLMRGRVQSQVRTSLARSLVSSKARLEARGR